MKAIELTLPEFAFLDGNCHTGDTLDGRDVIIHTRSASVFEIFESKNVLLKENIVSKNFEYKNIYDVIEHYTIALHYSTITDTYIINDIVKSTIEWYKNYMRWEDEGINRNFINEFTK